MPKVVLKLSVNVQGPLDDLPPAEDVAAAAAEMFEQAAQTIRDAGGKCQRTKEWKSEEE